MASLSDRTARMMQAFRLKIGGVGGFWGVENTKMLCSPIDPYRCDKARPIDSDAEKPRPVINMRAALILAIVLLAYIAQLAKSVISRYALLMVYFGAWPRSSDIQPRQTMRKIMLTIYANSYMVVAITAANYFPSFVLSSIAGWHSPSKNSSFWVVMKQFAQSFCGKIGFSHDAPRKLIGQRPACVDIALRASLF